MILDIPLDIPDDQQSFMQSLVQLLESQERQIAELLAEIENIKKQLNLKRYYHQTKSIFSN